MRNLGSQKPSTTEVSCLCAIQPHCFVFIERLDEISCPVGTSRGVLVNIDNPVGRDIVLASKVRVRALGIAGINRRLSAVCVCLRLASEISTCYPSLEYITRINNDSISCVSSSPSFASILFCRSSRGLLSWRVHEADFEPQELLGGACTDRDWPVRDSIV